MQSVSVMDALDKAIVNQLQQGLPVCDEPYAEVARQLGTDEATLLARIQELLTEGTLSRFGPMYHAERLGGGLTLAAMQVPEERFDAVADIVNAFAEVAHNYRREHALNMWFVLATETPQRIGEVIRAIEQRTGLTVYDMPKRQEFFIGLRFEV